MHVYYISFFFFHACVGFRIYCGASGIKSVINTENFRVKVNCLVGHTLTVASTYGLVSDRISFFTCLYTVVKIPTF
jgi:hypothetical protein